MIFHGVGCVIEETLHVKKVTKSSSNRFAIGLLGSWGRETFSGRIVLLNTVVYFCAKRTLTLKIRG